MMRRELLLGAATLGLGGLSAGCSKPRTPQGARDAVDAFQREGGEAVLREYAGVGHEPSDKMHADLWADMQKAIVSRR